MHLQKNESAYSSVTNSEIVSRTTEYFLSLFYQYLISWPKAWHYSSGVLLLQLCSPSYLTIFPILFYRGIDLTQWKELLRKEAEPADLANFVRHMSDNHVFPNKVLVDCTADTSVASHYYDWLKKGIHVITPNKKANSGPLDRVTIWLVKLFFYINLVLK